MSEPAASGCDAVGLARVAMLVASVGLAACQNAVGEGGSLSNRPQLPGGGDERPSLSESGLEGTPEPVRPCGVATEAAHALVETHCVGCHGAESPAKGGFDSVLDVALLVSSGKVVPSDPETSPLFVRVAAGVMPPQDVQKRPSQAEIQALSEWIACGAPDWQESGAAALPFVSVDARVRSVLADLRALANPVDRERMRYIDLSALANVGYSNDQLQVFREAVFMLLNSLSRGRRVILPQAIDESGLIYRVDLRDYEWDADTWRLLEDSYPYAIVYDKDSRLFPFDEVSSEQIRAQTGTSIPIIQADWFLSHASRPPLYHSLLDLPATLSQLEAELGVDIEQNIAAEQVLRAGFQDAFISKNHGVLERHDLGGNRGGLWISYNFESTLGQRNVFVNPLDFQADGLELIFNLDNGLQAYFLVDAAGRRIDKAPSNLIQDPLARDGAVENGTSCLGCHQTQGLIAKADEVRDFALTTGASAQLIEAVLGLYSEPSSLSTAFAADQERYLNARAALAIRKLEDRTFRALDNTHLGLMDVNFVAAVLGVPKGDLERALDASGQAFPSEILALRVSGGRVQRDAFDSVVGDVIEVLGLGVQLRAGEPIPTPPRDTIDDEPIDTGFEPEADDAGAGSEELDAGATPPADEETQTADAGASSGDATTSTPTRRALGALAEVTAATAAEQRLD